MSTMSMSYSLTSELLTDEGRSTEGEGHITVASESSSMSNKVMVEQIFPEDNYESECLLPESMGSLEASVLKGQCCTAKIYNVDLSREVYSETSELEVSAFLNEVDPKGNHIVELCCGQRNKNEKSYFHLDFEDQIRKVQLLPLPLSTSFERDIAFNSYGGAQTCGILLLVVSKRTGMSLHSIILSRKSSFDQFHISEFAKVSRGKVEDTGPCLETSHFLDNTRDESGKSFGLPDPILYVAILPCRPSARAHRIDVLACPLVCHKSPLFRFNTRGPSRALRRSMVLTGVGNAMGISISARRLGMLSFCTFAALFESELKVISLPSLDKWNKQPLKPEDIFTVPLNGPSMELPSAVIPLGGTWTANTKSPVSFAVLCHLKQGSIDVAQEQKSPMLSPWAIEASPIEAVPNRVGPPPQWTAKETRNAVLRARRDIMANVLNTLHGEASARKGEAPLLQSDELGLVTPKGKGTVPPDGSPSTVLDEDFDVSIPSPDTAVLDMSEMWMRRIPSDSCLSSLAGLNFEGNDDSSVMSFKNNEKHFATPQNPTGEDFDDEYPSEPSARLLIVSVPEQKNADTTNPIKTQVHNLPRGFRLSIEAIAMKQCPTEILVAVKPASSFDIRVLRVPMARGLPTSVVEDLDIRVCPVPIKRTHFDGKVKALDWDTGFDGTFQLRVVTARNADIGLEPVGPDELFGHIINVETSTLAGMSVSRISGSLNELSDQGATNDNLVTEKLELIMNTLLRFESTVNQRLNRMEKRMKENSDRLTRLEEEFSSRVEI